MFCTNCGKEAFEGAAYCSECGAKLKAPNKTAQLLPIGSVVMLKNGTKAVMVIGFYTYSGEHPDKVFDYSGCMYPEGMIGSDLNLLFNHDQIQEVLYTGYQSEQEVEFKQKLAKAFDTIQNDKNGK